MGTGAGWYLYLDTHSRKTVYQDLRAGCCKPRHPFSVTIWSLVVEPYRFTPKSQDVRHMWDCGKQPTVLGKLDVHLGLSFSRRRSCRSQGTSRGTLCQPGGVWLFLLPLPLCSEIFHNCLVYGWLLVVFLWWELKSEQSMSSSWWHPNLAFCHAVNELKSITFSINQGFINHIEIRYEIYTYTHTWQYVPVTTKEVNVTHLSTT